MGSLKVALFLAYKSIIKGNRWALALIILVMSLSFANLILTPSILSGVTNTLNDQQVNTLFANIIIDPEEDEYYLSHVSQVVKKIEQTPGVTGVSVHLNSSAFMEYQWQEKDSPADKGKSGNWSVVGIDPLPEAEVTAIQENIIDGSYLETGDRDKIVLGIEIAGGDEAQSSSFLTLGEVQVGDNVWLTYANGVQREYEVKGIFWAKETQADRLAFVTRTELASVMGRSVFTDRASQILVKTEQMGNEEQLIAELEILGINGEIRSWREYGGAMSGIVSSFDVIVSLINGIGLVVAAIVMFIVIYISVLHKRRQIGILRAIGIKTRIVITSYLAQALFYAVLGITFGELIIHFAIGPYFANHPLNLPLGMVSLGIEPAAVLKAVWGLISAAIFAGFIPVLSIIRQSIIKSIWGN